MRSARISVDELLEGPVTELCRGLPAVGHRAPDVALRLSAALDRQLLRGVSGLFALTPFSCRERIPSVRSLWLSYRAHIDEFTARCFSRLVNLRVESNDPLRISWFAGCPLEGLSFSDGSVADLDNLVTMSLR